MLLREMEEANLETAREALTRREVKTTRAVELQTQVTLITLCNEGLNSHS